MKRPGDGAGDGFVTSIRGLFNSQRRKAKAFVLRTMRGDGDNEYHDEWSESDGEYPFARQLTITKAKKLLRRHTKKFRPRGQKNTGIPSMLELYFHFPSTSAMLTKDQVTGTEGIPGRRVVPVTGWLPAGYRKSRGRKPDKIRLNLLKNRLKFEI